MKFLQHFVSSLLILCIALNPALAAAIQITPDDVSSTAIIADYETKGGDLASELTKLAANNPNLSYLTEPRKRSEVA